MNVNVTLIDPKLTDKYESFLHKSPFTLLYASNRYRMLLKEFTEAEDCYFVACDDKNEIVGVLPSFIKRNQKHGNVLNSLPFYGSNGGIIEFNNNQEVRLALLDVFNEYAKRNECVSSTLITSPFEDKLDFYEMNAMHTFRDDRIGQVTKLPSLNNKLEEDLMALFHSKTRNMIRKAQRSELGVQLDNTENTLKFLAETHNANIKAIGGIAKPSHFFELIPRIFRSGIDYKIFMACFKSEMPVAALLLFYFNKTVEYFTPVIVEEYRQLQALSLLIFEAMKDAARLGYIWWNWGGTWKSQKGVYHFKKRWGTEDYPYFYYTKIYDREILSCSREELLAEYATFYVVPFEKLKQV